MEIPELMPKNIYGLATRLVLFGSLLTGSTVFLSRNQKSDLYFLNSMDKQGDFGISLGSESAPFIKKELVKNALSGSWSPDGKEIVYAGKDPQTNKYCLCRMDIWANKITPILEIGSLSSFEWIKEGPYKGKVLLTGRDFNTEKGIRAYTIDPSRLNTGTDIKEIDLGMKFDDLHSVTASPDGKTLAIINHVQLQSGETVWIKRLDDNSKPIEVFLPVSMGDSIIFPSFSPDSSKIAFVHLIRYGAKHNLWIKDLKTNKLINLHIETNDFDWSPDGKEIVYQTQDGIFRLNIDSQKKYQLTSGQNFQGIVTWTKNGKIYYNTVDAKNDLVIRRMNENGSNNELFLIATENSSFGFSPQNLKLADK